MQLALAGQDEKERKESTRSERLVHTDFADHPRTSCRSLILFFVYCNSAEQAVQETSTLKITNIPKELTVPVAYGITLLNRGNQAGGQRFIDFLLSLEGQDIFVKWGFAAP